jgi:hypothetical protein
MLSISETMNRSFVGAFMFGVLVFVAASFRNPLYPALVYSGIAFLVVFFVVYLGLLAAEPRTKGPVATKGTLEPTQAKDSN